jgi:uncharacterized protein (DUF1778 family)
MGTKVDADKVRITARIPATQQRRVEEAAALRGVSTNSFIVQAALREANAVIAEDQALSLSEKAIGKIVGLMEHPPEPTSVARRAATLHRELIDTGK